MPDEKICASDLRDYVLPGMLEALSKESGFNIARENFKRLVNYAMSPDPVEGPSEIKQRIRLAITKLGQDGALKLLDQDLARERLAFERERLASGGAGDAVPPLPEFTERGEDDVDGE